MKRTKIAVLFLTMCLCLSGCGTNAENREKQQALKQEGMELQASGDYGGAIEKYEEALKLSNMEVGEEEIDLAYYKASAQYRSGDLEGAIDTYSAILAIKESGEGYLGRGILYVTAKEADKAGEDLTKALKENDSPMMQGFVYYAAGETDKAKEFFEKAKSEGESDAVFFLANIYEKAGDHNYAMLLLEEYIDGGKAGAEGYLTVGRNYIDNGSYEDALSVIQSGIALGESGVLKDLLVEEIACYERLGDFGSAREKAGAYLKSYPDDTAMLKEYEFLRSR